MTTVAESITKIRRLVRDENSSILTTDTPILNLIGRMQQEFARDTMCLVKVRELQAPSEIAYAVTHNWEEGYVGSTKVFCPFFRDGTYATSQTFELAGSYNLAGDQYTITCGDDAVRVDPQHPLPLFPEGDYFKPKALFWNYKAADQKSYSEVDDFYEDGWAYRGTEVDYFSHAQGLRRKALVTRAIPYVKPSDIVATPPQSLIGNTLRANVFILCYVAVPSRPTATTESLELNEPFIKYLEYRVASRLLKSYYHIRDLERAEHFEFRYKIGVQLVKRVVSKQATETSRRFGGVSRRYGNKPPYPRLPQHYPPMRLR
jgi:hypothetical protein